MKLEVIQKLRESTDSELAAILIQLLISNNQVYAAFVETQFPPETVSFEMINNSGYDSDTKHVVSFTMLKTILNDLVRNAPTYGNNKVGFIKEVRQRTGASLLEAKLFADSPIHDYTIVGWARK